MRRSRRRTIPSITAAAALVSALVVTAPAVATQRGAPPATDGVIVSTGPLTSIDTAEDLRCQVEYEGVPQFYGERSCSTTVASGGTTVGRDTAWSAESQRLDGSGTASDPFVLTTEVTGDGWGVIETDTYVSGAGDYDSEVQVTNLRDDQRAAVVSHAADCYLQGGDFGYGIGDVATGAVTCLKNPPASEDPGQVESFIPLTPGSEFAYGYFGGVYDEVDAGRALGNRMLTNGDVKTDNGMGISWSTSIAGGATETFRWRSHFLTGEDPSAVVSTSGTLSDTDGDGRAGPGDGIDWTVAVENTGTVELRGGTVSDAVAVDFTCPAVIAVGATADCTSEGPQALTQGDVDAGAVRAEFTFSATTPRGTTYTAGPSTGVVGDLAAPAGSTTTVVSGGAHSAGDVIRADVQVRNDGNVTLTGTTVAIDDVTAACAGDTLAPGATTGCTLDHVVTQAESDAGHADLHTTGTADTPSGGRVTLAPSDASVEIERTGSVSAMLRTAVRGGGERPGVGDRIGLMLEVHNSGNVSVHDIAASLPTERGAAVTCPAGPLAPGATIECDVDGDHEVTQADVDSGSVSFAALVTAVDAADTALQVEATATQETEAAGPALAAALEPTSAAGSHPSPGDEIGLVLHATNDGNVTLSDLAGSVTGPEGQALECSDAPLPPGASTDCTVSGYHVTQQDIDDGRIAFGADVTAEDPHGTSVSAHDEAVVVLDGRAGIAATVSAERDGQDAPRAGDAVRVAVTVRNDGDLSVHDLSATVGGDELTCPEHVLAPRAEVRCTAPGHEVTQAEIDRGSLGFEAEVSGKTGTGSAVAASDSTELVLARVPAVTATSAAVLDANDHEVPRAGDTVTLSLAVANTGNTTVDDVTGAVAERQGLEVTCPSDALAPGTTTSCVVSGYTLTQADVDAGGADFDLTATARGADGERVASAAPRTTVVIVRAPAITAQVTAALDDAHGRPATGDEATVDVLVRNTGNTSVRELAAAVAGRDGLTVSCPTGVLAPGEQAVCSPHAYALTQDDLDEGAVSFDVDVTAVGADGGQVEAQGRAGLTLSRQAAIDASLASHLAASEHDAPAAGDRIGSVLTVRNTGNVTVTGTSAVSDQPDSSPITCPTGRVAPGESVTCAVPEHVITQTEIDRGAVEIAVTTEATGADRSQVTDQDAARVGLSASSGLDVAARALVSTGDPAERPLRPGEVLHPGDEVRVRYTVTNTGNLEVSDLRAADGMPRVACRTGALEPGERTTCTVAGARVVTEAEARAGELVSEGRFTGRVVRGAEAPLETDRAVVATAEVERPDTSRAVAPRTVWVFSDVVRTVIAVESAPMAPAAPDALAFTGTELVAVAVPSAVLLLIAGLVLLATLRRRRADERHED
jgi:hypothetical protein